MVTVLRNHALSLAIDHVFSLEVCLGNHAVPAVVFHQARDAVFAHLLALLQGLVGAGSRGFRAHGPVNWQGEGQSGTIRGSY